MLPDNQSTWSFQLAGDQNLNTHNRGLITSLWINPHNIDEIYAGSNTAGLFRTASGGVSWECVTDNINLQSMGVNDIAVNPDNLNIKYIAYSSTFRDGAAFILKTTDNCETWQIKLSFTSSDRMEANRVVLDPVNPNIVYALVRNRVYRSMNAGASWELVFNMLTHNPAWWDTPKMLLDIKFKTDDHNTVFITGSGYTNYGDDGLTAEKSAEIWYTTNATSQSVVWQRIMIGLPIYCKRYAITMNNTDPSILYLGYSVGNEFNIKKLNLDSNTLIHVYNKLFSNYYDSPFGGFGYWCNGFELSPTNPDIIFCGGYNLEVLNIATQNYTFYNVLFQPHADFHVDQRVFKTTAANGKTYLFCGNDGGVSRYEYETATMKSCNGPGLDNNQYYGIGHSEVEPDFYIGGTQDNGVIGNGSGVFKAVVMGDAYEVIVDPVQPNIVYATANGGEQKHS